MTKQTELLRFGLLALAAGAIVYFVTGAKKKTEATLQPAVSTGKTPSVTVAQKLATATTNALGTLSESEIKRYAGWIDRIIQILAQSRIERKSQYGLPTEEALSNADGLTKLSNANLRAVANYWIGVRGNNLTTALNMFVDESQRLMELVHRLRELGLIKL